MSRQARKMVLNRNFTLTSRYGHSIRFEKGAAVNVPPLVFAEALQIGAEFADDAPLNEEEPAAAAPLTTYERKEKIRLAIEDIVERNNNTEFTAAGVPKEKAVERFTGFEVSMREIRDAWNDYHAAIAKAREEA